MAQGGTFKSGFASGFSASFFSPGTTMGGDGAGGFGLRTSIAAIVGGTASALGGGKFSNGAISGAFVHMFNAEAKAFLMKNSLSKEEIMSRDKAGREAYMNQKLQNGSEWMNNHPAGDGSNLKYLWGLVSLPYAIRMGITAVISYPLETSYGVAVVNDFYNESLPPTTIPGQIKWIYDQGANQRDEY